MKINRENCQSISLVDILLLCSFFLSGCCALMYQVGWQRSLYGIVGADIDSITIIVSVFMLGIGFGGMIGGFLADKMPRRKILFYSVAEISIAIYGWVSLEFLQILNEYLYGAGGGAILGAVASFAFLILPTTLMGMTLPILTMAFNDAKGSIGVSVSQLYFINTLGAAVGAGLVPFVLLQYLPLNMIIRIAAFGNLIIALVAIFVYKWRIANK